MCLFNFFLARGVRGAPDTRDGGSAKQDPFLRRARLELNFRLLLALSYLQSPEKREKVTPVLQAS